MKTYIFTIEYLVIFQRKFRKEYKTNDNKVINVYTKYIENILKLQKI